MAVRPPLTHYQRLGVARDATQEQIRAAYYARARQLHPDRLGRGAAPAEGTPPGADAEMAAVNEAWRVLREPGSRRRYDQSLGVGAGAASSAGGVPRRPPGFRPVHDEGLGDEVPERGERAIRGLPWIALLVVLGGIFVLTAFARRDVGGGDGGDDGRVTVGSCVQVVGGRTVAEVACSGEHRVRVVAITSGAVPCKVGLESYDLPSGERVCVKRS